MQFNLNTFRTCLTLAAGAVVAAIPVLGCTTLPDAVTVDCANSWVGPTWGAGIAVGLMGFNLFLKAFQGGGFGKGLVSPTVVVSHTGAPGTVTPADVR